MSAILQQSHSLHESNDAVTAKNIFRTRPFELPLEAIYEL